MTFTIPSDQQLIDLYKAAASILNTEGVKTPPEGEAEAFISHYGTTARLLFGTVLGLIDHFKTKSSAGPNGAKAPTPAQPTP